MQQFMNGLVGAMPRAAALTAVVAVMGLAAPAHAVVVYSGPVNIPIPDSIDGVYLNVVTGAADSDPFFAPDWDVTPYSAAPGQFNLWGPTTTTWLSPSGVVGGPYPLAVGTEVGAAGLYFRPGGGTDVGAQVTLGAVNYFGFRFANEAAGDATHYGVLEVTFGGSASSRAITGWLYDDAGGSVIAGPVPEPETYALWLAGLAAVAGAARRGLKKR
jgi:hypothetical protein